MCFCKNFSFVEWPELDTSNFSVFHAAAKFADEYRTAGGLEVGGELQLIGGVYGRFGVISIIFHGRPWRTQKANN